MAVLRVRGGWGVESLVRVLVDVTFFVGEVAEGSGFHEEPAGLLALIAVSAGWFAIGWSF